MPNARNPLDAYKPMFTTPAAQAPAAPVTPPPVQTGTVVPTAQEVVNNTRTEFDYAGDLIRDYEKYDENAYWDEKGKKWTVGWGFTSFPDGRPVKQGDKMDRSTADKFLSDTMTRNSKFMSERYKAAWKEMKPNERAALLDLAHNLGPNWEKYKIIDGLLKSGKLDREAVAREIPTFRKSGGQVVEGLVNRRKDTLGMWQGAFNDGYLSREERLRRERAKPKK